MSQIATILNTVTNGIHHGETRSIEINPGETEALVIATRIRQLYDQGFFMRATTPGSITKAHSIATVTTASGTRYLFRKSANGTLTYRSTASKKHMLHYKVAVRVLMSGGETSVTVKHGFARTPEAFIKKVAKECNERRFTTIGEPELVTP